MSLMRSSIHGPVVFKTVMPTGNYVAHATGWSLWTIGKSTYLFTNTSKFSRERGYTEFPLRVDLTK